ncbi:MAG: tRNA epoxyqueuosine(34) reductase QueG [bacterium]|nr:tRNA epoxyqueuosine(34) reductase QueG [bacterium]
MEKTKFVKELALSLGFDDVRIASALEDTPYKTQFQQAIAEERHGPLDYMSKTAKERADVLALMPEAKSVVVVAKNYYTGDHEHKPAEAFAKVSRYAWGGDYHHWFKKRLRKMRTTLQDHYGDQIKVHIFNDTGPVLERGWAERSGLGFIGKSGMLIHREFGTWTFLGGFVTDLELKADKPTVKQMCGTCTACIDACPTGAIVAPQKVDARLCLTTWNVERPLDEGAGHPLFKGHGWAVGCDICQEVCPWNKFEQTSNEDRFKARLGHSHLSKDQNLTDIAGTPLARAGQKGLKLNIDRALFKKY